MTDPDPTPTTTSPTTNAARGPIAPSDMPAWAQWLLHVAWPVLACAIVHAYGVQVPGL